MQTDQNTTETPQHDNQSPIIAALNDRFRQTYWGGKVMTTSGVNELSDDTRAAVFAAVESPTPDGAVVFDGDLHRACL